MPTISPAGATALAIVVVLLCVGATAGAYIRINGYLYDLDRLSKIADVRDSKGERLIPMPNAQVLVENNQRHSRTGAGLTAATTSTAVCEAIPEGPANPASESRFRTAIQLSGTPSEKALLEIAVNGQSGFTMQQLALVVGTLCKNRSTSP